jgi:hypothetical protein
MRISKSITVQELRNQFSDKFPSLKIELYSNSHNENSGSNIKNEILHDTLIGQIVPDLNDGEFLYDGEMSVNEFENGLKEQFGLNVQVFRKSKGIWLQTTSTDQWSLNVQNGKGFRSTIDHQIPEVKIQDYDLE